MYLSCMIVAVWKNAFQDYWLRIKEIQLQADFEYELMAEYYGKNAAEITFKTHRPKDRKSQLKYLEEEMIKHSGMYMAYLQEYIDFKRNKFNKLEWFTDPKVLLYRSSCARAEYRAFQALCEGRPVKDVVVIREQFVSPCDWIATEASL